MYIESNSRQVPKQKEICASKKYHDILYAYLQCISEPNPETGVRFVDKKEINFSKLGQLFGLSRQTVSTKFKGLVEMGLIEQKDEGVYLQKLDQNIAALVPYGTLKLVTDTLSENSVNTYVYLLKLYYANECKPVKFTLEQIKRNIGICATTRSNDEIVTNIMFVLQKLGLIKYQLTTEVQADSSFKNVKTIYELEWLTNKL
jgi:DNA-binding transcriptional ArsR family regulator